MGDPLAFMMLSPLRGSLMHVPMTPLGPLEAAGVKGRSLWKVRGVARTAGSDEALAMMPDALAARRVVRGAGSSGASVAMRLRAVPVCCAHAHSSGEWTRGYTNKCVIVCACTGERGAGVDARLKTFWPWPALFEEQSVTHSRWR